MILNQKKSLMNLNKNSFNINIALIVGKKHSKGLPGKNIKKILGRKQKLKIH